MPRIWLVGLLGLFLAGCAGRPPEAATSAPGRANAGDRIRPIITPSGAVTGQIVSVNPRARFVVISYPIGALPALEKRLSVYRNGLKVADLKATGPQRDTNIAADIISGECRPGDEVRDD